MSQVFCCCFFFATGYSSQSLNITMSSIVQSFQQQLWLFRQLKPLLNPTLEAIKLSLEATELVFEGFSRVPRIKLTRAVPTAPTNKVNAHTFKSVTNLCRTLLYLLSARLFINRICQWWKAFFTSLWRWYSLHMLWNRRRMILSKDREESIKKALPLASKRVPRFGE